MRPATTPGASRRNAAVPNAARARLRLSSDLLGLRPSKSELDGSGVMRAGAARRISTPRVTIHQPLRRRLQPRPYISPVAEMIKRGRRPGPSTTREAIRAAARERFSAQGYDRVRMRDVAADAGVDVALVTYHFGSKDGLFAAVLETPEPMAALMADVLEQGGLEDFAERFLRRVLEVWDDERTGGALVALGRSAMSHPPAAERLRAFVQAELLARIADRLEAPDADKRAALFG